MCIYLFVSYSTRTAKDLRLPGRPSTAKHPQLRHTAMSKAVHSLFLYSFLFQKSKSPKEETSF